MTLAREVDPGELLVEADADVRIGLVVPKPDVEPGPVAPDELLLGQQGLGLGLRRQKIDRGDLVDEVEPAAVRPGEVRGDPFSDRQRLPHVEDGPVAVLEEVDAGLVG
jgi:hypothetical protein